MNKLSAFEFIPSHCPNCGKEFHLHSGLNRVDYLAKTSHSCDCGMRYQLVDRQQILEIAEDVAHWEEKET